MEKRFDGSVILVLQSGAHSKFSQTYIPFFYHLRWILTFVKILWCLSQLQNLIPRSLNSGSAKFKFCSQCVGDFRWWQSRTMVLAGNKAKHLSSVNHSANTIHHHQESHQIYSYSSCAKDLISVLPQVSAL